MLTTHTGSLPRPADLVPLVLARDAGEDAPGFDEAVREAVAAVVRRQVETGIDIVGDGEQSKPSYVGYAKDRLTGYTGSGTIGVAADLADFPDYSTGGQRHALAGSVPRPACAEPIRYRGLDEVERDIANLRAATAGQPVAESFLTAAAPGVIAVFLPNSYYPTHDAYIRALADAMRTEYQAIAASGLTLQVDCPDLALGRHVQFGDKTLSEFRDIARLHIEALNAALDGIPPDRLRMHLCWGNYEGPHHKDVPLRDIVDIVLTARPMYVSIEAANPRHEHEWRIWEEVPLPPGKVLIPGVVDTTTNFIEHPGLVAERLVRLARLVGPERVIAGTDCGFSTGAAGGKVAPSIVWAKLATLVEGARRASARL